jgi:hypothetical protein
MPPWEQMSPQQRMLFLHLMQNRGMGGMQGVIPGGIPQQPGLGGAMPGAMGQAPGVGANPLMAGGMNPQLLQLLMAQRGLGGMAGGGPVGMMGLPGMQQGIQGMAPGTPMAPPPQPGSFSLMPYLMGAQPGGPATLAQLLQARRQEPVIPGYGQ